MDEITKNDKKEKLNPIDPYDFDIKYSSNSPKAALNELKPEIRQSNETLKINTSDGV